MKINIIGTGNVATHLGKWLEEKGHDTVAVSSRTLDGIQPDAPLSIIAVTDGAIPEVAAKVAAKVTALDAIIAHTSGASQLADLQLPGRRTAVIYPMQTFTKGRELNYDEIPLFIEASDPLTEARVREWAMTVSPHVHTLGSDERARLHVAAVFACNYFNHLLHIAEHLLEEEGMELGVLTPLVRETVDKALATGPEVAQTGPARRHDLTTLWRHMRLLEHRPHALRLYRIMAQQIMSLYKEEE